MMATRRSGSSRPVPTRGPGKRAPIESQLAALATATAVPASPEASAKLREALQHGPGLVSSRAAKIVREHALDGFEADLVAAFRRLRDDPVKSDPGCLGKLAALEALDFGSSDDADLFVEATRYFQLEPAWGKPVDSAVGVRARGVLALARLAHRDLSLVGGGLLADPASPVRQAAAEALASTGDRAQAGALALRWILGDEDPLVVLACMSGLLAVAPDNALPRLRAALHGANDGERELAALALGQSTREEALDLLIEHLEAAPRASERSPTLRALGLQRNERALAALLKIVEAGHFQDAEAAVAGLGARRFDAGVRERTYAAAGANPDAARLRAALASAFPEEVAR
jgi:HEAT repeat protein